MKELHFLNRLIEAKLAVNPARVLLYISTNPSCHQKDMLEPLKMSRCILSQCCQLLINRGLIYQEGSYVSKTHELLDKGKNLVRKITDEQTK